MESARTVCIIGLGYIGLPTASLLATKRFQVHGVDVNAHVVETINQGNIHIHEPDLDVLVKSATQSGYLTASLTPQPADVFILAVPTPFQEEHAPDLSYIDAATRSIAPLVAPGNLIILESTSPVGTTERIADHLRESRPDLHIPARRLSEEKAPGGDAPLPESASTAAEQVYLAHCPERVLPGRILTELVENDRIIGGIDPPSALKAQQFYQTFVHSRIFLTDSRTAELCKLTENAYRDVNIAFSNEISLICDRLGVDVWELIEMANRHPRVNLLQPGPGVGGHCIAVDPWFIISTAPEQSRLIRTAREVNDSKPGYVIQQIRDAVAGQASATVACLGLTFKANVDDIRESPALFIVEELVKAQIGRLLVADPHLTGLPKSLTATGDVRLVDMKTAVSEADVVVLLVNHSEFLRIDRRLLDGKTVIDTRGAWR